MESPAHNRRLNRFVFTSELGIYVDPDLTRLPSKAKAQMASGQGSHWLIKSPTFFICVILLPEVCVNLVLKHIHAASSYTICR